MLTKLSARHIAVVLLIAFGAVGCASNGTEAERQGTVDQALATMNDFKASPDQQWFRQNVQRAQGVAIFPRIVRAGFIFGGSGGSGVLLGRDVKTGTWSNPSFHTIGSVTFGLQIGATVSNVVALVMTQRGMNALLSTEVNLGTDVSIAVGPVGQGVAAATTDILMFSRDRGLFGGLTVDGSVISPRPSWNADFYGQPASPADILIRRNVSNPGADALINAVTNAHIGAT